VGRDCRSDLRCRGHLSLHLSLSAANSYVPRSISISTRAYSRDPLETDRRPCTLRKLVPRHLLLGTLKSTACRTFEYKYQVKSCRQCHIHLPRITLPTSHLRYDVIFSSTSDLQACSLSHFVTPRWCARLAHPARCHEHWRQVESIGLHG
jgi:hypothetical protein